MDEQKERGNNRYRYSRFLFKSSGRNSENSERNSRRRRDTRNERMEARPNIFQEEINRINSSDPARGIF